MKWFASEGFFHAAVRSRTADVPSGTLMTPERLLSSAGIRGMSPYLMITGSNISIVQCQRRAKNIRACRHPTHDFALNNVEDSLSLKEWNLTNQPILMIYFIYNLIFVFNLLMTILCVCTLRQRVTGSWTQADHKSVDEKNTLWLEGASERRLEHFFTKYGPSGAWDARCARSGWGVNERGDAPPPSYARRSRNF